jgi:ribose 5-phosphate isomerase A
MLQQDEIKKLAGVAAAAEVQPGMTIGIGTGSTAYWAIMEIGKQVKEGLMIKAVPTSKETNTLASSLNIPLLELNDVNSLDLTIDGADEIDPELNLIKGGGGALLQEKMVAAVSHQLIIIADSTKMVKTLGAFPLPVEVVPYGWKQVQHHFLKFWNIETSLRAKDNKPFMTDHGHFILDCHFVSITDPYDLCLQLNNIPGVVENGLFVKMATSAIIGYPDGTIKKFEV